MFNKLKLWLFPTSVEGFKFDALDRDGDGLIQEGTSFERKVTVVKKPAKKAAAPKKKVVKKAEPAKKKAPVKKTAPKKTTKKK
jgi:hypothetical protein